MFAFVFAAIVAAVVATPSPSPSPTASPQLTEIGRVTASGRTLDLVGRALTASEGTISRAQFVDRPIYRPGEVLEAIPGLVISQHSGEGKANQYYLRGFNLDHGTDIASSILGMPINLPSHAHGQGYSDVNWLIPELISDVEFRKGPYDARDGDFATAGSYRLFYRDTIPATVSLSGGQDGYARAFIAASPKLGDGHLLYAVEAYHNDGSFDRADNYRKLNGVVRYSRSDDRTSFNVTAMGYSGQWLSTDQVPQRAIDAGTISRYGLIDPTDKGSTYRASLSAQYVRTNGNATTRVDAYTFAYGLDLFSNFTYFLDNATDYFNVTANPITCSAVYTTCAPGSVRTGYVATCPADRAPSGAPGIITPAAFAFSCGDQREQRDQRVVSGLRLAHEWTTPSGSSTLVGAEVRNDNIIASDLSLTVADSPTATLVRDKVLQRNLALYAQTTQRFTRRLRATAGIRADLFTFDVHSFIPENGGTTHAGLISPKAGLAYAATPNEEFYVNLGESFHSNDARGAVQTVDPLTRAPIDAQGNAVQPVTPIARAIGREIGYRYHTARLNSTVAFWDLAIASELTFAGDSGTTSAGRPTYRSGIELTNFWTPSRYVAVDADYAYSSAKFVGDDPIAPIGTHVPGALEGVAALGVTYDRGSWFTSARMRYFGPRALIEDDSVRSRPSTLWSFGIGRRWRGGDRLSLDVFNVFGTQASDIDYAYPSWLPGDARRYASDPAINPALGGSGVPDIHLHPSERRTLRLTFSHER